MTRALIPATTLAPTKELENPPTAAEVVEVEFAAEEVLVVDPLTSWLTTVGTGGAGEDTGVATKGDVGALFRQQPDLIVPIQIQQSSETGNPLHGLGDGHSELTL
jgi:hypothetical protein